MIRAALCYVCLLAFPQTDPPPTSDPVDAPAADQARAGPEAEAEAVSPTALAHYNTLREYTPQTAAAQLRLAVWCERNGLMPEAVVHYSAVVQLDPRRVEAWHKLGFKKHDGRWMNDAQIAAEAEQQKADHHWGPLLRKWHREIHGGKDQAAADAGLASIRDPRAVPSVYREFFGGGVLDQTIAVQVLGQIDSPVASKVLAALAIYGKTPEVRRRATETLRGRRAEEYLDALVGLMKDPIAFEVKPVGGPGTPGTIVIEGERANLRRIYASVPESNLGFRPGDIVSYDASGAPVLSPSGALALQNLIVAQQGAVAAAARLESDASAIAAVNREREAFNDLVINVAKTASGKDHGPTPKAWREALEGDRAKYPRPPARAAAKPTITEIAALYVTPVFTESLAAGVPMRFMHQHAPPHT